MFKIDWVTFELKKKKSHSSWEVQGQYGLKMGNYSFHSPLGFCGFGLSWPSFYIWLFLLGLLLPLLCLKHWCYLEYQPQSTSVLARVFSRLAHSHLAFTGAGLFLDSRHPPPPGHSHQVLPALCFLPSPPCYPHPTCPGICSAAWLLSPQHSARHWHTVGTQNVLSDFMFTVELLILLWPTPTQRKTHLFLRSLSQWMASTIQFPLPPLSPHTALLLPFLHPVRYTVSCFWVHSLPSVTNTTTLVLGVPVSHLDCGCISVFVFQPSSLVLSNPSFFTLLPDESEENCKLYQDFRKTEIKARGFLCSLYEATVGKCWRFVGLFSLPQWESRTQREVFWDNWIKWVTCLIE